MRSLLVLVVLLAASRASAQAPSSQAPTPQEGCIRSTAAATSTVAESYAAARAAYETGALDEAAARFRAIALDHPGDEVAPYAASLWLDTLSRIASEDPARRDACRSAIASALDPLATRYCARSGPHAELCRTIAALRCTVVRIEAERHAAAGRPEDASDALVAILGRCDRDDETLWNAATYARVAGRPDRALTLLERLVREAPSSPLAARARDEIARARAAAPRRTREP